MNWRAGLYHATFMMGAFFLLWATIVGIGADVVPWKPGDMVWVWAMWLFLVFVIATTTPKPS